MKWGLLNPLPLPTKPTDQHVKMRQKSEALRSSELLQKWGWSKFVGESEQLWSLLTCMILFWPSHMRAKHLSTNSTCPSSSASSIFTAKSSSLWKHIALVLSKTRKCSTHVGLEIFVTQTIDEIIQMQITPEKEGALPEEEAYWFFPGDVRLVFTDVQLDRQGEFPVFTLSLSRVNKRSEQPSVMVWRLLKNMMIWGLKTHKSSSTFPQESVFLSFVQKAYPCKTSLDMFAQWHPHPSKHESLLTQQPSWARQHHKRSVIPCFMVPNIPFFGCFHWQLKLFSDRHEQSLVPRHLAMLSKGFLQQPAKSVTCSTPLLMIPENGHKCAKISTNTRTLTCEEAHALNSSIVRNARYSTATSPWRSIRGRVLGMTSIAFIAFWTSSTTSSWLQSGTES